MNPENHKSAVSSLKIKGLDRIILLLLLNLNLTFDREFFHQARRRQAGKDTRKQL